VREREKERERGERERKREHSTIGLQSEPEDRMKS
jgi:hypothetical protein